MELGTFHNRKEAQTYLTPSHKGLHSYEGLRISNK